MPVDPGWELLRAMRSSGFPDRDIAFRQVRWDASSLFAIAAEQNSAEPTVAAGVHGRNRLQLVLLRCALIESSQRIRFGVSSFGPSFEMVQRWEIGKSSGVWKSIFEFRNLNSMMSWPVAEVDEILDLEACIRTDAHSVCEGFAT